MLNLRLNKITNFSTLPGHVLILLAVLVVAACNQASGEPEGNGPAKNIILFIGDGMGPGQLTAASYERGELHIARMPYGGLVKTHSTNRVTDSAAGATALSAGYVTDNRVLGQAPDGTPFRLITHVAQGQGKRTGLVATCRIVHATPAAFAVHHDNRRDEEEIALKFVDAPVDVILAGGHAQFLPEELGGTRDDGRNLIEEMQARGFSYFDQIDNLDETVGHDRVLGLFVEQNFDRYPARGDVLPRMTAAAIENLSRTDAGFFLMVEGAQIDWGGHDNDADWMIQEMIDFDNAIGIALDYAERAGNTLVIVTGDHETGGYTLVRDRDNPDDHLNHFSTGYHTATAIPVFAYGPGAERFGGFYHITGIGKLMFELWGEPHDQVLDAREIERERDE